jgi:hypothetical protein
MGRILLATLALGVLLNLFGWAGNVFLFGALWDRAAAAAPPPLTAPFPPLAHDALTFVSDFVFAFALAVFFSLASGAWRGSRLALAFLCAALVWLCGVPMTYLGVVNGGYLPADVATATSAWALFGFLLFAPLLPPLLPARAAE